VPTLFSLFFGDGWDYGILRAFPQRPHYTTPPNHPPPPPPHHRATTRTLTVYPTAPRTGIPLRLPMNDPSTTDGTNVFWLLVNHLSFYIYRTGVAARFEPFAPPTRRATAYTPHYTHPPPAGVTGTRFPHITAHHHLHLPGLVPPPRRATPATHTGWTSITHCGSPRCDHFGLVVLTPPCTYPPWWTTGWFT